MLTRLKVKGFKNLVDVDVRFGAFTCVAGANGVGKSNLFDAIRFLSALAEESLVDAALSVRDEGGRSADVRNLFYRSDSHQRTSMSFQADLIIPATGSDVLGQVATPAITFVRYELAIGYRTDDAERPAHALEILHEALTPIPLSSAREQLGFPHSAAWRRSVIAGRRTTPFLSTFESNHERTVRVHGDGASGRPRDLRAAKLPRTALSASNAADSPTMAIVREEMLSWRLLHLEPAALRRPDLLTTPPILGSDGAHLPASLYYLARFYAGLDDTDETRLYGQLSNRLAELVPDIHSLRVERDERLGLLTLFVRERHRAEFPASLLSDGTLRFLALATLLWDHRARGVLCLEEPENGISPERIPAMLRLLQDTAVDPRRPDGLDNPLRQLIVNTHSPAVVQQVADDSLLVAEPYEVVEAGERLRGVRFSCLPDTWRTTAQGAPVVARGKLLTYLNPAAQPLDAPELSVNQYTERRVIDREDIQRLLPFELS